MGGSLLLGVRSVAHALGGDVNGRDGVLAPGPGHSRGDRSLSIKLDPSAPDGFIVNSFAGDDPIACKDYVRSLLGLGRWEPNAKTAQARPTRTNGKDQTAVAPKKAVVERFDYLDEGGTLLFQVERVEFQNPDGSFVLVDGGKRKKTFRQRRPDPQRPGKWLYNANDVRHLPYRLPELQQAIRRGEAVVFVTEGEAKSDMLYSWGFVATCCAMGAGKWRAEHAAFLKGADVVIMADNDAAGRKHEQIVGASLQGLAKVYVLNLPGLPPKGDIKDWAAAGHTREEFDRLLVEAKPWAPRDQADYESQDGAEDKRVSGDLSDALQGDDDRPVIQIDGDRLVRNIEAVERALIADSVRPVFQRGGMLVRILRLPQAKTQDGISRSADAPMIYPVTSEWLRCRMNETVRYVKYDAREKRLVNKDPPSDYATALLSRSGQWRFPALLAAIEAPTMRADGTLLQERGYDDATGLYFEPGTMVFEPINENPSREHAVEALQELCDLLRGFPFIDNVARSVALVAILTAMMRRSLRTAPMFLFEAPTRGSGKSLLARLVAWIATGREAASMTFTGDPDEERKRLVAALMAGDAVLSYDNISQPLEGDTLCTVLTAQTIQDRRLGQSEMITVPTCAFFMGNGNNITVRGDLATRVLVCRIDPEVERPEERKFDRDLDVFVRDHRAKLVRAVLTILRAYVVAGRPTQPIKQFGRFEAWSDLPRAALVWLGCPDPCISRDRLEHDDPLHEALGLVLKALLENFGETRFSAAEVMNSALGGASALSNALQAALPKGEIKSRPIGNYLRQHKDRIVGGLRVRNMGTYQGAVQWRIDKSS